MQALIMSMLPRAYASTPAPYKIRKAPKHLFLSSWRCAFKSLSSGKNDILKYGHYDVEGASEIGSFIIWFDSTQLKYVLEVYWRLENYTMEKGFLCLLCGEFYKCNAFQFSNSFRNYIVEHMARNHCEIDRYYRSYCLDTFDNIYSGSVVNISVFKDLENIIYCDFRGICEYDKAVFAEDFEENVDSIEEKFKNSTNCYLCLLCGERYATTPSQEVITSHIKKCEYVKECANNDLSKYKVPASMKHAEMCGIMKI